MTILQHGIEAGARVAWWPATTRPVAYVEGRPYAPKGDELRYGCCRWRDLTSIRRVRYSIPCVEMDAAGIQAQVSLGYLRREWAWR